MDPVGVVAGLLGVAMGLPRMQAHRHRTAPGAMDTIIEGLRGK